MANRNYLIGFLVLLMALTSHFVNTSLAQDKFHVGQLLVAKPDMLDLRFSETVVFVCRHDSKGAFGLVLNRPAGRIKMSKLMESLGVPSDGVTGDVQIRFGGPVDTQAGFLMYSKKIENEDGICSSHGVTVSNNKDVLKTLGSGVQINWKVNSPEKIGSPFLQIDPSCLPLILKAFGTGHGRDTALTCDILIRFQWSTSHTICIENSFINPKSSNLSFSIMLLGSLMNYLIRRAEP